MQKVNVDIPSAYFPDQFVSDEKKATPEYGLRIGQAIQYEWFRRDGNNGRYYDRYRKFNNLRLYARGEQSIAKYKKEIAVDGDLSYLNLDWTPVPIIPKFVDIVVNGMSDRVFDVKVKAQDPTSIYKRNTYQERLRSEMLAKPILDELQAQFGINPYTFNEGELPESDEELDLIMQLKYKPSIEIAAETAISTVLEDNFYEDLKKRVNYDITVLGMGVAKHEFNEGSGVEVKYVDPANVIHSYTEDPYFKDCFYWGEVKTVPISELIKIDPSLTNEDLKEISQHSHSWYDYYNVSQYYNNDTFYRDTATLLYFNYKTTHTFKYKKKIGENGSVRMIEKPSDFNPPKEMLEEGRFEVVEKTIDVWYEGVMVMGTNIVLKWNLMENMVRPKSASQHAMPNYVAVAPRLYKGNVESLVRRMIPFADLIQITHLKLQQVMNRMTPDGVFIDADGLNEVDLGTGAAYNPEDALRLYFQTGSVIGRSFTQDGDFNNARVPIQAITGHSGQSKMAALINNYNHYLRMIRDVTGLNEARDGSTPDSNALVGVQKLAAANSNTATRHILDASHFMTRELSQGISIRLSDAMEYMEHAEEIAMQIGRHKSEIIKDISDYYMYDFGIFIEVAPDEEEKMQLEQNIQVALQKGDIGLEDAIDIREVKNTKIANQLLKVKKTKKAEKEQKDMAMQQQMQSQIAMQQQQASMQMQMQMKEIESQMRAKEMAYEARIDMEKSMREAEVKSMLMARQFEFDYKIAELKESKLEKRDEMKEAGKEKRIDRQNTQQSKLINQRKNNLPPMSFEDKQSEIQMQFPNMIQDLNMEESANFE
tara:strand:+ start:11643 stop:14105 length:2463 start_codon:yes stop_codon:yes gene_type:complete